jgi:hypothetical protein
MGREAGVVITSARRVDMSGVGGEADVDARSKRRD